MASQDAKTQAKAPLDALFLADRCARAQYGWHDGRTLTAVLFHRLPVLREHGVTSSDRGHSEEPMETLEVPEMETKACHRPDLIPGSVLSHLFPMYDLQRGGCRRTAYCSDRPARLDAGSVLQSPAVVSPTPVGSMAVRDESRLRGRR